MSKIQTFIAGLSIVAGLGVSALPLTSYAAESVEGVTTIRVTLEPVISMTLTSTSPGHATTTKTTDSEGNSTGTDNVVAMTILPNSTDLTSMKTVASVTTNSPDGYTLTVKDYDTDNALRITGTSNTIPAQDNAPAAPTAGWALGYTKDGTLTWSAVPISTATNPLTLKNTGSHADGTGWEDDETEIKYGVATSSSQLTGTYTDKIVYTATTRL